MSTLRPPLQPARRVDQLASSIIRDILRLTGAGEVLSLAGGLPAPESFPVDRIADVAARLAPADLQYAPTEGLDELREWIAERLRRAGRDLRFEDVLVTTGSQQALSLIGTALVDPGHHVAIDEPGYLGAIQALAPAQPTWRPVPVTADGPDLDAARRARAPRLHYTVTESSNPAGVTASAEVRRGLAELAEHHGTVVVEDRAYDGLHFDRSRRTVAPSIGTWSDRVLSVGTLSKVLAPGLRVGWIAGPPDLIEPIRRAKQAADLHTSTLGQRIAIELLRDEVAFERHVDEVVARHRERAEALVAALRDRLGDRVEVAAPSGGMFVWAHAPGVDTHAWLARAVEAGVAFVPGMAFAATERGTRRLSQHLRLSFATLGPDRLREGVERLEASLTAAPLAISPG